MKRMKRRVKFRKRMLLFLILSCCPCFADPVKLSSQDALDTRWYENLSLSYLSFFEGPGLAPGMMEFSPNVLGLPNDDGLKLSNNISVKYKLTPSLAFDMQLRFQWILNNARDVDAFQATRWQSPRVGVSGTLLSGENWKLTGAVNTDFPYSFPQPVGGGTTAQFRTTLLDPGLFTTFSYQPKKSPWSVVSLVTPRFFFYRDRNVAEPQLSRAGFSPTLKNEFIFDIAPTLNYALSQNTGLRLGTEIIYCKLILSGWNPFKGSLNLTNTENDSWRLAPVPLQLGITHRFLPAFNVSLYMQSFPIAAQRFRRNGSQASWFDTASVGMWINGSIQSL